MFEGFEVQEDTCMSNDCILYKENLFIEGVSNMYVITILEET